MTILRSEERGKTQIAWLESRHSFSFGEYYDPQQMAFRSLRVINDDKVAPGMGFGTHPHRDMEILTYMISGELQHRDSMGNGRIIRQGELQAMTAGSGITHSEFNPSRTTPAHLLQIWIMPAQRGLTPSYAEWKPPVDGEGNELTLLASPTAEDSSVLINQDVRLFLGKVDTGRTITHRLQPNRAAWLHLISGELEVSGERLFPGDAIAIEQAEELKISTGNPSEFLLFDLA
ncbi:MAG: pirin family protein [Verrucomicrobiaceae bacterium]|nr:MAG: pirin family protein [Verrucomicrobiaceae bacterium]